MGALTKEHGNYHYDPSRIWKLDSQGFTKREIAEKIGCGISTVYYHLAGYNYKKRIELLTDAELIGAEKHLRATIATHVERLHTLRGEARRRGLKRKKGEQKSEPEIEASVQ